MKAKLFTLDKKRPRSLRVSVLLSVFFTGAGQVYACAPLRGIVMLMGRSLPLLALPLYVSFTHKESYMLAVLPVLIFSIACAVASPIDAYLRLRKSNIVALNMGASPPFLGAFIALNVILLWLSIAFFNAVFAFVKITDDKSAPHLRKGDIVMLLKKKTAPAAGEVIAFYSDSADSGADSGADGNIMRFGRAVLNKKGTVITREGRIYLNGAPVGQAITGDEHAPALREDEKASALIETNGRHSYFVFVPLKRESNTGGILYEKKEIMDDELFTACDNRTEASPYSVIKKTMISARVEGVFLSSSLARIFSGMYLD
ncbi:MAG: hypothetical protein LBT84_06255 [Spirochaetia bacterium]|nr:hypothetical protein [Spirochaetia bacterium]